MMSEVKWKSNWDNIIIYLYLGLPVLIFVLGWLKLGYALVLGALIIAALVKSIADAAAVKKIDDAAEDKVSFFEKSNKGVLLAAVSLIVLWVLLSGIGGYCWQNNDHQWRNAIFHALVEYDWPVISQDGSRGLVYYIGFWLPAACIGKVFNVEAGYAAQAVWAIMGIFIAYYLICVYRKKVTIWPVIFLIFFSGLDYVGLWLTRSDGGGTILASATHIEWWAGIQFSSTTTQLFWVFNQAIPAWVATILILKQKNCKNILFILSLVMLPSTFSFVGLIPIVIYLYIKRVKEDRNNWKEIVTLQNIIGVIAIGGCIFLYLVGNIAGGEVSQDAVSGNTAVELYTIVPKLIRYLLFYGLEFGVYIPFICLYRKKDSLLKLVVLILVLCPFIRVGSAFDFCMRASIPALFILMILCIDTLEEMVASKRKYLLTAYCIILLFGAITPFNEIHRTLYSTINQTRSGGAVEFKEVDMEQDILHSNNFSGNLEGNLFFQYFVRDIGR